MPSFLPRSERTVGLRKYLGADGLAGTGPLESRGPRVAALDGLRAIAILLVLMHNAGSVTGGGGGLALTVWVVLSNAGWVGVQVFFALSGFLITRILLESKGADGWMRSFYVRRLLRIAPLYYATLLLVFFVVPRVPFLAALVPRGSRSSLWYWTYLSNWAAPFGGLARALPHVWSLAVEEQFYLIWPLAVAAVTERTLAGVCVIVVIGAFVSRIVLHLVFPPEVAASAAYTWTVSRCDAIAMGAIVALCLRNIRAREFISVHLAGMVAGAIVVILGVFVAGRGLAAEGLLAERVGMPVTGALSALLVLACVVDGVGGRVGRRLQSGMTSLLSTRPLATIGKYSYAVYVFHLPVHLVLRPFVESWLSDSTGKARLWAYGVYTAGVFATSLALALISWRLLEQPFLSLKRFFPMRPSTSTQ